MHLRLLLIESKQCRQIHHIMRGAHFPHRPRSTADNDALASHRPAQSCIGPCLHIVIATGKSDSVKMMVYTCHLPPHEQLLCMHSGKGSALPSR